MVGMFSVNRFAGAIIRQSSVSLTAHPVDGTVQTIYTFSAQNLGTAPSKKIALGISGERNAGSGTYTVSAATVDGNSCSLVKSQTIAGGFETVEIWEVNGITATSGDVVITWNGAMRGCGIGVYEVLNAATSSYATAGSTADPMNASVAVPAGGIAIAVAKNENTGGLFAWTNLTEKYDEAFYSTTGIHTGACDAFASEQTSLSVTADPSDAGSSHAMALASWGPA